MTQTGKEETIDIAPTINNSLLSNLFSSVIQTRKILSINNTDTTQAASSLARIKPPQIGSYGHSRMAQGIRGKRTRPSAYESHLRPLPRNANDARHKFNVSIWAKTLLDHRIAHGSGSTGWSRAWIVNLYARLFDDDSAWNHTQLFLQKYPSAIFWNTNASHGTAFQIDGNFGFTAGVAEMLLQSHAGVVHLLPALPSAVPKGNVSGLVARGNLLVDIEWTSGKLTWARIAARAGGKLTIRVQDDAQFTVNGRPYTGAIASEHGEVLLFPYIAIAVPESRASLCSTWCLSLAQVTLFLQRALTLVRQLSIPISALRK